LRDFTVGTREWLGALGGSGAGTVASEVPANLAAGSVVETRFHVTRGDEFAELANEGLAGGAKGGVAIAKDGLG
jgi:hypothetical protein